jgi:DivIVA domain-containing protein
MANTPTSDSSPQRFRRGARASELLRDASFPLAVRGYDRRAVDEFLEELRGLVDDLEAHQTREGVVQKALNELGEETAGILQRAHETADEIAARSRAQADGRLQRAEREAEILKRDADDYAERVVVDTRLLWDERQRLIDDIRQLADEVLGTSDDAMERLKLPEPLAAGDPEAEPTTSEAPVRPIPHPLSIAPRAQEDEEEESDPSVPYDMEAPDPDATGAWELPDEAEDEYATENERDPDATAPWPVEAGGDEDAAGEPQDTSGGAAAAREDSDHHTVELEALPGGNADEQAAERERNRRRD